MLCRRFCDSDPEFEPGLNRDLAIQAKTATLATKDSPAAQISPPWPWPEPTRTILSREGLPRQETGLGEARPAKRPSGHRTTVRARHGAPLVKGNFARDRDQCDWSCPCVGCDEISPIRMTRGRESSLSYENRESLDRKRSEAVG